MEYLYQKSNMISKNFCNWQFQRECDNSNGLKFKRNMQVTDNLVARLGLEKELEVCCDEF